MLVPATVGKSVESVKDSTGKEQCNGESDYDSSKVATCVNLSMLKRLWRTQAVHAEIGAKVEVLNHTFVESFLAIRVTIVHSGW